MKLSPSFGLSFLITTTFLVLIFASCKKEDAINHDSSLKLGFSADSVIFDTVFTTIGSVTKRLMIYNKSDNKLIISNINLTGGTSSAYRINLDGEPGSSFSDVEINGNDSLYLFVRVTINPLDNNNPYVVEDELSFFTNGNEQHVKLIAWGQDAHYIVADTYSSVFPKYKIVADSLETVHWTNDRPYVIYGYAVINSYGTLIIDEGARIYFHDGGGLWAYSDGLLQVKGTLENPVTFQGDRLESSYDELPGQWDRIWLMESTPGTDHLIENAVIKNGYIGLQSESFIHYANNLVKLHNVIIENMSRSGILSHIYNIEASNTILANCGGFCLEIYGGGYFNFKQSTIGNFWPYSARNNPAVYINNYLLDTLDNPIPYALNFTLANSIVYGSNKDEFEADMVGGADSLYFLSHSLVRSTRKMEDGINYESILRNEDPLFKDVTVNDYRLDTLSPAIDYGDPAVAVEVPYDILNNQRLNHPDAGAYQFMPGQEKK
ncbi:MAG: hypothetical protein Q8O72_00470 [Bacteroidales bacterium]|nr:hypothetical protein [Bacteroidales bacterium]